MITPVSDFRFGGRKIWYTEFAMAREHSEVKYWGSSIILGCWVVVVLVLVVLVVLVLAGVVVVVALGLESEFSTLSEFGWVGWAEVSSADAN